MRHRHLNEAAGRELTKAAIEDILTRGNISAWRGLVQTIGADQSGRIAGRVNDIVTALGMHDSKVRAFATLLPQVIRRIRRPKSPK
jgi:hypothetical protein